MGRKRKESIDSWLPDRVYRGRCSYEYRPKGGKCKVLCKNTSTRAQVLHALDVARGKEIEDLNFWLDKYFLSHHFAQLKPNTQTDYRRMCSVLAGGGACDGIRAAFGSTMPSALKTHHIRQYMDQWGRAGKYVTANRHQTFLLGFFNWLRQQMPGVDSNPASRMTRFKEKPRKVYIDDGKYNKLLSVATQSSTPYVAAIMEIAYLCGLRKHEVLLLNIDDIRDDGLHIYRGKGSMAEITQISPRLQDAINVARSINHDGIELMTNRPLFRSNKKSRVSASALDRAWRRIKKQAGIDDFLFHDLKKKAGTDGKDLGHRTQAMRDLYDLRVKIKAPTR